MNGRVFFNYIKYIAYIASSIMSVIPNFILFFIWDVASIFENKIAIFIRYCIVRAKAQRCGDNVLFGKNVTIKNIQNLKLGSNISIHSNCWIDASGGVEIHDNVSIAHNSTILSSTHTWDSKEIPIKYNELQFSKTTINSNVWIGCGVRLMAGIDIGHRAIIGANSVCTKSLEGGCIYAGSPAREIKKI